MTVRAKLTLEEVRDSRWGNKTLVFTASYDPTIPEDQRFQKATPSGRCELQIDNPVALAQFELGKAYYVDFTPVSSG